MPMRSKSPIIVVGASAGGVKALCALVKALPAPSPVPIYIVLHTGAESIIDEILTTCDSHNVRFIEDGEQIKKGIYVAHPRRHLVVNPTTVGVSELGAPKREHWIPSIDELFESTAKSQGSQSIGVILSGTMHDGVSRRGPACTLPHLPPTCNLSKVATHDKKELLALFHFCLSNGAGVCP